MKIGIVAVILAALGLAVFSQRTLIRDAWQEAQQPDLPAAVSYEELQEREEEEDVPLEEEEPEEMEEAMDTEDEGDSSVDEELLQNDADGSMQEEEVVEDIPEEEEEEENSSLPTSFNLAVPFTSQAPHANWELPYKEACEEASVYMVHEYYEHTPEGQIAPNTADAELLKLVEFQNGIFGDYEDTDAQDTAIFASQFYGYGRVEVIDNPSATDIKEQIAAGRPVIVPAAGRLLGNPNFTPPGPLYHMLVVRGYTEDGFITNDPGTRNGEAYFYTTQTLMNAIHDWNEGDVLNGDKRVLVIYPEK